jgi:hypothetical protein
MLLSVVLVLAAWIVLSIPVAVIVGRMLGAGHVALVRAGRTTAAGAADRVAYLSRVETRRAAASRWPHETRVLCASRRGHSAEPVGAGRFAG